MESPALPETDHDMDHATLRALLEMQVAAGADEAICDAPLDRYALEAEAPKIETKAAGPAAAKSDEKAPAKPAAAAKVDAVAIARASAQAAQTLEELAAAMAAFPHCDLRKGARSLVFADGSPDARVMIVGEGPGRDEDREGRPFVGRAGQLLDRMFAAIDLSRQAQDAASAVYITNVVPWRPPSNRAPDEAEIAMMLPFLERHITLANPEFLVLMGNTPCQALLGRAGITRMRGNWAEAAGRPALPMFHPAYLLRTGEAKREAWADLLSLRARLNEPCGA